MDCPFWRFVMKLAAMTFSLMGERVLGLFNASGLCEMAKAAGVDALDLLDVELMLYGRKKLKQAMAKYGIRFECLIGGAQMFSGGSKVPGAIDNLLKQAADMGASMLMLVPGQPTPAEKKACLGLSADQKREVLVKYYRYAVEKAKAYHIQVVVENTPQYFKPLASAEDCLWLMQHVEGLGLVFDTANMKVADTGADETEFYRQLKPYIRRVHLKDVVIGPFPHGEACASGENMQTVQAGSGMIRIRELLGMLKEDGYQGSLVIEYSAQADAHGKEHYRRLANEASLIREMWDGTEIRPPYSRIEGIDLPVPRIFFGTAIQPMLMGQKVNGLLDSIYAQGVYAFDCARGYGGAEKSLGTWIRSRNNRDRVIILTKCGNVSLSGKVQVNREVIEKELATSLKTLGTDYIDIYLLHRDDPQTPVSEIIDCLNEAKRQGKIRVFGVSNWTHERIAEANAYAQAHGLEGFAVSSPNFGLANQVNDPWGGECVTVSGPSNAEAREWYTEKNMPVIAYSSLGRGFFSGRFRSGDYEGAKKILDGAAQKGYLYPENMERLRRAEELAEQKGCSVAQIAMSYIFNQPMRVFAVVSTTNPGRMHENIQAAWMKLTPEETAWLENYGESL